MIHEWLGIPAAFIAWGFAFYVYIVAPPTRGARVSNAAMPNTHATPEYESFRKLQVYETAVHAALEDGHISKRQRRVLDSMLRSMGIDAEIAARLEADARSD